MKENAQFKNAVLKAIDRARCVDTHSLNVSGCCSVITYSTERIAVRLVMRNIFWSMFNKHNRRPIYWWDSARYKALEARGIALDLLWHYVDDMSVEELMKELDKAQKNFERRMK